MKRLVKIGDIFEIPIKNNQKGFGQFVYWDKGQGPLIQVFSIIVQQSKHIEVEQIIKSNPLFPPVITGLKAAIRSGMWKVIGNQPVKFFSYPMFVSSNYDEKTGEVIMWYLWDGEKYIKLGRQLPQEFKNLEYLIGWNPSNVVTRIETGEYPFPYGELIRNNKYTPRKKV